MLMFGPLNRSWCMRFEAKHSYFKSIAKVIRNFKNLPLSLASRHQNMELADNITLDNSTDPSPLFQNEVTFGRPKQIVSAQDKSYVKECLLRFHNIQCNDEDGMFILSSVTLYGTLYKPGKNNYIDFSRDAPEFGRIIKIWYIQDCGIFFVLQVMDTVYLNEALNAFHVEEPTMAVGHEILSAKDIAHPNVCHAYIFDEKSYIVQRENINV